MRGKRDVSSSRIEARLEASEFPCEPALVPPTCPEMLANCVVGVQLVAAKQVSRKNTSGWPLVSLSVRLLEAEANAT